MPTIAKSSVAIETKIRTNSRMRSALGQIVEAVAPLNPLVLVGHGSDQLGFVQKCTGLVAEFLGRRIRHGILLATQLHVADVLFSLRILDGVSIFAAHTHEHFLAAL